MQIQYINRHEYSNKDELIGWPTIHFDPEQFLTLSQTSPGFHMYAGQVFLKTLGERVKNCS